MKSQFITMDVEPDLHTGGYDSLKALPKFLSLLKKYNVKATFFITCDCLEKSPGTFRKIILEGHEIGLHGYKHKRFDSLTLTEKKRDISNSLICFKKYLNIAPLGFRAPQHSIDSETITLLKKNNFKYDSSISPWNLYHLIFFWKVYIKPSHNFLPMRPHRVNELLEIPISSFILPFSSFVLRVLPKFLLKFYLKFISSMKEPVFLMHSWDLIEIPESKIYSLSPLPIYLERFEYMLEFLSKRKFATLKEITSTIQY